MLAQQMAQRLFARASADQVLIQRPEHCFQREEFLRPVIDHQNVRFAVNRALHVPV